MRYSACENVTCVRAQDWRGCQALIAVGRWWRRGDLAVLHGRRRRVEDVSSHPDRQELGLCGTKLHAGLQCPTSLSVSHSLARGTLLTQALVLVRAR